jgi:hypothetical protein
LLCKLQEEVETTKLKGKNTEEKNQPGQCRRRRRRRPTQSLEPECEGITEKKKDGRRINYG